MTTRFITLILSLLIGFFNAFSQDMENWITENEKVPVEKIYVHTDAEYYFQGDTLWYKIYLIDSHSGRLIPSPENIYVELVDDKRTPVVQSVLLSVNGQAFGSFYLPDTIKPGNFVLHAFTNYLLNFSSNVHFYKQLSIARKSGLTRTARYRSREENMVADVAFLPEGGILLENVTNLVAFKAISREGYGVNSRGIIKDENGATITSFSTDYKGMGLFFLTPVPGKTYDIQISGFPSFKYSFKPVEAGIKIQLVNHTSKEVIVNVISNTEKVAGKTFYLVNMYRGEVLFYQDFQMEGMNKLLKFENSMLKAGINRLVLLDKNLKPVSERLLFERPLEMNNLVVETDMLKYNKRSDIKVSIADKKYTGPEDFSNLSVTVVNKEAFPENGVTKNILSQFLINSEIKGFVESSADLFVDNEISSEAKLRLVMLTNGWSSYLWNDAPAKRDSVTYKQTAGLNLSGVAVNPLTESPVRNGEITLIIHKDTEMAFLTRNTDEKGHFKFKGLLFNDTASIYVQAKAENGNMNTDISVEPFFPSTKEANAQYLALNDKTIIPEQLSALKYEGYLADRKFYREKYLHSKKENKSVNELNLDSHFSLYNSPDFVLKIDEDEKSFGNVIDYMVGKVSGVDINGEKVIIRGTSAYGNYSTPLFLIDGVPLVATHNFNLPNDVGLNNSFEDDVSKAEEQMIQIVKSIPIHDVEKIEILKSPQNLAVFGTKGANGVIAIYTRHGKQGDPNQMSRGIIEKKITGYASSRQFYSPKYTPDNVEDKRPDYRTTLYWDPQVITQKGLAKVSFFSSDSPGEYFILVEGVSNDGKICLGTSSFEVTP